MKSLILALVALLAIGMACPLTGGRGAGSQVNDLLTDPEVGLDGLSDYQAALTVSFSGTVDGQAVESRDTYTQSEWPALQAEFTTIETVDESRGPSFLVTGSVGQAHYAQQGQDADCTVRWGANAGGAEPLRLASTLEAVDSARLAGQETIDGIPARHYTFEAASLGLPADVQADGEVWIANDGGYVVKYALEISAAASYYGEGAQGTSRVEYSLSQVGARAQVAYPGACLPVLADVPAMEDAADLIRLPGLLAYSSASPLTAITAFYTDLFEGRGWEPVGDHRGGGERAVLIFGRSDTEDVALVTVQDGADARRVAVNVFSEEPEAASAPGAGTTPEPGSASNPALRVAGGLNILLGMDPGQPGLPSYHMEAYDQIPTWEGGVVVHFESRMTADVQGQDVHFIDRITDSAGSVDMSEAYLIGGEEYDVENGVVQPPGVSMTGLAWTLWPLDVITILGTGASSAQPAGIEVLDGRTAEIYDLDASGAAGGVAGVSLSVTAVRGRVWIDQETGALLKAELDYDLDVKDADGEVMGSGAGRLEIDVTLVGEVSVALPAP